MGEVNKVRDKNGVEYDIRDSRLNASDQVEIITISDEDYNSEEGYYEKRVDLKEGKIHHVVWDNPSHTEADGIIFCEKILVICTYSGHAYSSIKSMEGLVEIPENRHIAFEPGQTPTFMFMAGNIFEVTTEI